MTMRFQDYYVKLCISSHNEYFCTINFAINTGQVSII